MSNISKRQERLKTLQALQSKPDIIKEADILSSVIDVLKTGFQQFFASVQSTYKSGSPVTSILEFLAVGYISSQSIVLGILFSILTLYLDINVESIFATIKSLLGKLLSSPSGQQQLQQNPDQTIYDMVDSAVSPEIKHSDDEINSRLQEAQEQMSQTASESHELIKHAQDNGIIVKNAFIGKMLAWKLPAAILNFGAGRKGIVGIFFWIVKTLLIGVGFIGLTGAAGSILGGAAKQVLPTNDKKETSPPRTTEENIEQPQRYRAPASSILSELRVNNVSDVIQRRSNNAPDDLSDENRQGKSEWVLPAGDKNEILWDWVLNSYTNINEVFTRRNISENQLREAINKVSDSFKTTTDGEIRVPSRYKSIKDIADDVIRNL